MSAGTPPSFAAGRYSVVRSLGTGGHKEVFLARDERLGREVAVSWIKASVASERERERLRREVQALARLGGHPRIVTILDAGEEEGRPFLVTEFMSGESIALWLEREPERRLPPGEALRVARQIAEALAFAHARGILHRDIKPANVWRDDAGDVKLGDFGLALFVERPRVSSSGSVLGTPEYMAPEQALGRPIGPASDLYALGALLYELLAGRPPFLADTPIAVVSQHLHAAPVAPSWHAPDVPPGVDGLVLRLLAKSERDRPATAEDVCDAIRSLASAASEGRGREGTAERNPLDRLARGLFVGRAEEMSRLQRAFEESLRERPSLTLIAGEAGIGKSRLAEELCTYARMRGALAATGRGYEGGGAPAFWPVTQALRALIDDGGAEVETLARSSVAVSQMVAGAPDASASVETMESPSRFALFAGVTRFFVEASRLRPLLVVIDDLHWLDGPSLALLPFLVREIEAARVCWIVTYRDTDIEPKGAAARCLAALRRRPGTTHLRLHGLPPAEVRALVESSVGRPLPPSVLDRIVRDAEGNPFFIEELLRHLEESAGTDGGRAVADPPPPGVPPGVREVIGARLARLSEKCRDLLTAAAALGREFSLQPLERVVELNRSRVLALLDEARAARVVAEVPGVLGAWRFEHALVRETLYDRLSTVGRIDLHRRIGQALEDISSGVAEPPLAELAHHFHRAALGGDVDRALSYADRAGAAATANLAFEEAALQYGRAFELAAYSSRPDPVARCRYLLLQAESHHRAGEREAAQEAFLRAAGMARALRGSQPEAAAEALGRAAFGLGGIWGTAGVLEQPVVDLLEEAVAAQEADSPLHARLLARLSVAFYWSDQVERRIALSRQAREMAARLDDPATQIYVLDASHYAHWGPDTLAERLELADEMIAIAARSGELGAIRGSGYFWRVIDNLERGDIAAVDRDLEAYSQLAEQWAQPHYRWYASVARAMRALLEGRLEEGRKRAEESLALGERAQGENATHFFAIQQLEIARLSGEVGVLVEPAARFVQRYPAIPAWRAVLSALYASLGDFDAARRELDGLARSSFTDLPRDANFLVAGYFLAETIWALGDVERAASLYERLRPYAEHNVVVANAALCLGSISHGLGRMATLLARRDEAVAHFERAIAMHRGMGARPAEARTQIALAESLLRGGSVPGKEEPSSRARALLGEALAMAGSLGLPGIEADARRVIDGISAAGSDLVASTADLVGGAGLAEGVLQREGEYWTIGWQGEVFRLKDALGLRYLARLLASPGRELHCAELFAYGAAPSSTDLTRIGGDLGVRAAMDEDAGELLDERAKEVYRARLRDLDEEIAEAESFNDVGRLERARAEKEAIEAELARSVGLGGRDRKAASRKEQARLSVTRAIRSVMRKMARESPALAAHLRATVKTGTFCSYTPDPRVPLEWRL